jgi:hypothetical protein
MAAYEPHGALVFECSTITPLEGLVDAIAELRPVQAA